MTLFSMRLNRRFFYFTFTVILLFSCSSDEDDENFDGVIEISYNGKYELEGIGILLNNDTTLVNVFKKNNRYYVRLDSKYKDRGIRDFGHLYLCEGRPAFVWLSNPTISLYNNNFPSKIHVSVVREKCDESE